ITDKLPQCQAVGESVPAFFKFPGDDGYKRIGIFLDADLMLKHPGSQRYSDAGSPVQFAQRKYFPDAPADVKSALTQLQVRIDFIVPDEEATIVADIGKHILFYLITEIK